MAYEIAKLILEQATSHTDRAVAIRTALQLRMPIYEIEEYLDWLDLIRQVDSIGQDLLRR